MNKPILTPPIQRVHLVYFFTRILVKQGTIILNEELQRAGFVWGKDYAQVLHIHDEIQFEVKKDKVEKFKEITKSIFKKTQDHFNFRCPLDGEIKVGQNWSDTH